MHADRGILRLAGKISTIGQTDTHGNANIKAGPMRSVLRKVYSGVSVILQHIAVKLPCPFCSAYAQSDPAPRSSGRT